MSSRVWFDAGREHVWRVPAEFDLPPGDVAIYSFAGDVAHVDVDALAPFGLDRGEAQRAVLDELSAAAAHTGRALGGVAAAWLAEARAALPPETSWAELERRLGPMEEWVNRAQARERVQQGREVVEQAAQEAKATWKRATRVARSAASSGWAVGKVMLEHPELAEAASKLAAAMARSSKKS